MREVIVNSLAGIIAPGALFLAAPEASAQASTTATAAMGAPAIATFVSEAAQRFGIPEGWIYAVMRVESGGDPRARSPKGAAGLMQLMLPTWRDLQARYGLGNDIWDPRDNILAGTAYLRELYDRYGSPGYLAAYNAGPPRYEDYLRKGRALPVETTAYVSQIALRIVGGEASQPIVSRPDPNAWTRANLFITQPSKEADPAPASTTAPSTTASGEAGGRSARPSIFIPLSGRTPQ